MMILEKEILLVREDIQKRFPNCNSTVFILIWDDNTSSVEYICFPNIFRIVSNEIGYLLILRDIMKTSTKPTISIIKYSFQ